MLNRVTSSGFLAIRPKRQGAKILLDTPVKKLVIDEKTRRVRGVIGRTSKKKRGGRYGARKAVILTSRRLFSATSPSLPSSFLQWLMRRPLRVWELWRWAEDGMGMRRRHPGYALHPRQRMVFDLDAKSIATDMSLIMYPRVRTHRE